MCVKESENKEKALQCLSMYMTIPQALSSLIFFLNFLIDVLIWHNVFQIETFGIIRMSEHEALWKA